jgi:hypothetical protein
MSVPLEPASDYAETGSWEYLARCGSYLGACYIERRNFEITATSNMDGGLSCLSGRTAAFRTHILTDNRFINSYCNELWRGKVLNTDDDNFITRWLVLLR